MAGTLVAGGVGYGVYQVTKDRGPASPPAAGASRDPSTAPGGLAAPDAQGRQGPSPYEAGYVCDSVPGILGSLGLTAETCDETMARVPGTGNYSRADWSGVDAGKDGVVGVRISLKPVTTEQGGQTLNRADELARQAQTPGSGVERQTTADGGTFFTVPSQGTVYTQTGPRTWMEVGVSGANTPDANVALAGIYAIQLQQAAFAES